MNDKQDKIGPGSIFLMIFSTLFFCYMGDYTQPFTEGFFQRFQQFWENVFLFILGVIGFAIFTLIVVAMMKSADDRKVADTKLVERPHPTVPVRRSRPKIVILEKTKLTIVDGATTKEHSYYDSYTDTSGFSRVDLTSGLESLPHEVDTEIKQAMKDLRRLR